MFRYLKYLSWVWSFFYGFWRLHYCSANLEKLPQFSCMGCRLQVFDFEARDWCPESRNIMNGYREQGAWDWFINCEMEQEKK